MNSLESIVRRIVNKHGINPDDIDRELVERVLEALDPYDAIMSVKDASKQWEISLSLVKQKCDNSDVDCMKLGKEWIIARYQPKPEKKPKGRKPSKMNGGKKDG